MFNRLALIALLAVGAVSANAIVLFQDGFETGDFSNWDGVTGGGSDPGTIDSTVFHSGAFSAKMPGSTTAGVVNGRYANLDRPGAGDETIILTFWMKLAAASGNNRHYNELRSYSGDAYNTGTLEQIYAMGAYNAATVNGTNTSKWQARIAFNRFGGPSVSGWYTLDQAGDRTTDWTKFTMEITPTTIQFYVNDVAGLATPLDRGNVGSIDSLVLGSRLSSFNIDSNMDDFRVEAVPEPATLAVLGLGAAAMLRRRWRRV